MIHPVREMHFQKEIMIGLTGIKCVTNLPHWQTMAATYLEIASFSNSKFDTYCMHNCSPDEDESIQPHITLRQSSSSGLVTSCVVVVGCICIEEEEILL
jgi:hypothetical protein